ncbi:MAG: hypothetical protein H7124_18710 [Phycisphaerales bacterium]|nr:hypothetical protein [Hyphomonadaceae bacterium]
MLRVLGLLTGWVLLTPLALVIYLRLGGPFMSWMAPAAGIAISVPMLGFFTLAGIAMIFFSVRSLARQADDF